MIYLILAILSSALISICMRFGEKHVGNQMGMFMANFVLLKFNMKSNGVALLWQSLPLW